MGKGQGSLEKPSKPLMPEVPEDVTLDSSIILKAQWLCLGCSTEHHNKALLKCRSCRMERFPKKPAAMMAEETANADDKASPRVKALLNRYAPLHEDDEGEGMRRIGEDDDELDRHNGKKSYLQDALANAKTRFDSNESDESKDDSKTNHENNS